MNSAIAKSWRDAATLIVLGRLGREAARCGGCNYEILLQTRTQKASFKNSVVFPGGVTEAADSSPEWLQLIRSFGYTQRDFASLHRTGAPVAPLFQNNPVQRHVALRITAIRETFEELGLLICSRTRRGSDNVWASTVSNVDVKYWQKQVAKDPGELLRLCKELECYPDIWSLHYWNNWLTPPTQPKRFDTAFFVTALDGKPDVTGNTEVAKVEWSSPIEILKKSADSEVILYAPQSYELHRLAQWARAEALVAAARERSALGSELFYHAVVRGTDGDISVLPGDDLYPSNLDYSTRSVVQTDKTVAELRANCKTLNRFEIIGSTKQLALKNCHFYSMDTSEKLIPVHAIIS